jgi:hypothetical protein
MSGQAGETVDRFPNAFSVAFEASSFLASREQGLSKVSLGVVMHVD